MCIRDRSYEGIEAAKIYVQGGKTCIVSTDDGANAAGDEPTENAITLSSDDTVSYTHLYLFTVFIWKLPVQQYQRLYQE